MAVNELPVKTNCIEYIPDLAKKLDWQGDTALLEESMRHRTCFEGIFPKDIHSNQRLEFLGDAILGFVIGRELFLQYPDQQEGYLSQARSKLVCEGSLAELARDLNLQDYLMMGHGGIKNLENTKDSTLSDAFEALVGAMYLSQGLERTEKFLLERFTPEFAAKINSKYEDYKGRLQHVIQAVTRNAPRYRLLSAVGPTNNCVFTTAACYQNMTLAVASGTSKKEAEKLAAKLALERQNEWLPKIIRAQEAEGKTEPGTEALK